MSRSRALVLVAALVLANLGFWAWQAWYAAPARGSVPWRTPGAKDAKPAAPIPGLGSVRLAGEAAEPPSAPAAVPTAAAPTTAAAAPAVGAAPPPAAGVACYEVGPFTALADSAAARESLQQRGYASQLAYAAGVVPQLHLVRIDGLPTAADQARVLSRLRAAGIADVAALPGERAVSLGVFSEAPRAEARSRQVRAAGFAPRIVPQYASDAPHHLRVEPASPLPPGVTPARALAGSWRVQPCAVPP